MVEGCRAIGFGLVSARAERLRSRRRTSWSTAHSSTSARPARARADDSRRARRGRSRRAAHRGQRSRGSRARSVAGVSQRLSSTTCSLDFRARCAPHPARSRPRTASSGSTTRRRPTRTPPTPRCRRLTSVVWIVGGLLKGVDSTSWCKARRAAARRDPDRRRPRSAALGIRATRARAAPVRGRRDRD